MATVLPVEQLHARADARPVDAASVAGLADSISALGLINPIRVRRLDSTGWEVIAGLHRLAAVQSLGLADIECVIVEDDDLHAELAMIDENLCRAELSPSDRARQTARRKAIYEELHPETRHGGDRRSDQVANSATRSEDRFSADTAAATGKSERTVQLDAERGAKVIDEVLALVRGTPLDTGTYLDRLKRLPPNEQVAAARRDIAAARQKQRQAGAAEGDKAKRAKIDADVKQRAAREAAEIIAEYVPADAWDGLKANLYAAGAKAVADELMNVTGQSIMDRRFG